MQASTFLIEYDNTQNNANDIHSVWRDFNGDFGQDLLKAHYQTSHGWNEMTPAARSALGKALRLPVLYCGRGTVDNLGKEEKPAI